MGTAERQEPERAGSSSDATPARPPGGIGGLLELIDRYGSVSPVFVGWGVIASAVSAFLVARMVAALPEFARRLPTLAQRAGVIGLGWGVLLVGLTGFVAWLLYRLSSQRQKLKAIHDLSRQESQAVEALVTTLARLARQADPLRLTPGTAQLADLVVQVLNARHGVELLTPNLKATLASKEGNTMRDALDSSIDLATQRPDGNGDESMRDGR
jgi:hypothetical protein